MTVMTTGAPLQVYTLGSFDVCRNEQSLVSTSGRSYRLWELFKYVLTNREKPVFIDYLIDFLWSDKDSADPYNALKTQMYRLRKQLGQDQNPERQYIIFSNNCYKWNQEANTWLDVAVFEDLVEQGRRAEMQDDREEAFQCFSEAAVLYKGRYLVDMPFSEWLLNARNHYHRLYIETVTFMVNELAARRSYDALAALCEEAFKIEYFEENWHHHYIEALLQKGKQRLARAHYESVAAAYQKELGVFLSPELRQLSRRILGDRLEPGEDLESITRSFRQEANARGAFTCEPETFRKLYELEMRRNERNGQSIFLGMIYLEGVADVDAEADADADADANADADVNANANAETDADMKSPKSGSNPARGALAESIISGLRRGDVVTEWRPNQYLVLLPGLNFEQAEKVLARLVGNSGLDDNGVACELLPLQITDIIERMEQYPPVEPLASMPA